MKAFVPAMSVSDLMTGLCLFVTLCFGISVLAFGSRDSYISALPQHATAKAGVTVGYGSVTKARMTEPNGKVAASGETLAMTKASGSNMQAAIRPCGGGRAEP
jgi:hypothetical protein